MRADCIECIRHLFTTRDMFFYTNLIHYYVVVKNIEATAIVNS